MILITVSGHDLRPGDKIRLGDRVTIYEVAKVDDPRHFHVEPYRPWIPSPALTKRAPNQNYLNLRRARW